MTSSIRIFEKSNFTPKLSFLVFLKVKLPNMTDWHNNLMIKVCSQLGLFELINERCT